MRPIFHHRKLSWWSRIPGERQTGAGIGPRHGSPGRRQNSRELGYVGSARDVAANRSAREHQASALEESPVFLVRLFGLVLVFLIKFVFVVRSSPGSLLQMNWLEDFDFFRNLDRTRQKLQGVG